MVVHDQELLNEMKQRTKCDYCGAAIPFADPHHLDRRGVGGGTRLDIRQNIASICPTFYGNNCHHKVTIGRIKHDDMLACVAKREKTTPDRLRRYLDACHNTPKEGPLPAWEKDMQLSIHPIAETFPEVTGKVYERIKASIAKNGVRRPVLRWRDQLMDGRTRMMVCKELGIECPIEELECDEVEAMDRAIDENAHRRHLDSNAYLMSVARAVEMMEAAAKSRQLSALEKATFKNNEKISHPSASFDAAGKNTVKTKKNTERTREAIAKKAGVSPKTAERAIKVNKHAPEEVKKAVAENKVKVADAAAVAKKPPEVQRVALAKIDAGEAKTLVEAVAKVEEERGDIMDARGRVIPKHLLDKYHAQQELAEQLAILDKVQPVVTKCENILGNSIVYKNRSKQCLAQARDSINHALDGFVCPLCEGEESVKDCACCAGKRWLVGGDSSKYDDKIWRKGA